MTDIYQEARDALDVREQEFDSAWSSTHADATHMTTLCTAQLRDVAGRMKQVAANTAATLAQLNANDLMPREGRDRLIRECKEQAHLQMASLDRQQATIRAALAKELTSAALPKMPKDRELPARQELLMLLQGSKDPVALLTELAAKGGELGAAACSSFGESYLRAQGMRPRDAIDNHSLAQSVAVANAVNSPDPAQARAARAYAALGTLSQWTTCTREAAWGDLRDAGVER